MPSMIRTALATGVALVALTASAFAQFTERTIRVSNGINQDHPVGNGLAKMNQCVGERSGGKMKLQGFWGGAMGGDLQATQALRSGTQEMVITSTSPLVGILPPLGVFTYRSCSPATRRQIASSMVHSARPCPTNSHRSGS